MRKIIITVFCLVVFFGCNDNPNENNYEAFSGITRTSEVNYDPIGEIDPNDWKIKVESGDPKKDVVTLPKIISVNDTVMPPIPTTTDVFPAYPNPTYLNSIDSTGAYSLSFSLSAEFSNVEIFLYDKPNHIIDTLVSENNLSFGNYRTIHKFNKNLPSGIYRVVFKITTINQTVYSAYGDVQFIK